MENGKQSAFACANEYHLQQGLTKREYFAAMAMQGTMTSSCSVDIIAEIAVKMADALLVELEKTKQQEQ